MSSKRNYPDKTYLSWIKVYYNNNPSDWNPEHENAFIEWAIQRTKVERENAAAIWEREHPGEKYSYSGAGWDLYANLSSRQTWCQENRLPCPPSGSTGRPRVARIRRNLSGNVTGNPRMMIGWIKDFVLNNMYKNDIYKNDLFISHQLAITSYSPFQVTRHSRTVPNAYKCIHNTSIGDRLKASSKLQQTYIKRMHSYYIHQTK